MEADRPNPYDRSFFRGIADWAHASAQEIVPIVMELVRPASVVELGCGTGAWLAKFVEGGVARYLGIDGDYVERGMLQIDPDHFLAADLTRPLPLGDARYDLAVSLEVAEHLPPDCADGFVDSLVALAPVVLFSAAIPYQGGTNHVNERWQGYWAERFAARGFVAVDAVRDRVWENTKVAPFYAQNIVLYVDGNAMAGYSALTQEYERVGRRPLNVVHPRVYLTVVEQGAGRSAEHAKQVQVMPSVYARVLLMKWLGALFRRGGRGAGRIT